MGWSPNLFAPLCSVGNTLILNSPTTSMRKSYFTLLLALWTLWTLWTLWARGRRVWAGVDNMDVVHPCPHVPQGEGHSEGLVHKSTWFFPDNQLINCTTALIHTQKTEFYPQILPKSQINKLALRAKTETGWVLVCAPSLSEFLFFRYLKIALHYPNVLLGKAL